MDHKKNKSSDIAEQKHKVSQQETGLVPIETTSEVGVIGVRGFHAPD